MNHATVFADATGTRRQRSLPTSLQLATCALIVLSCGWISSAAEEAPAKPEPAETRPAQPDFKTMDANTDGKLSLDEFLAQTPEAERMTRRGQFYRHDTDTDEFLTEAELAATQTTRRVLNEFRYRDLNGNKQIELDEFIAAAAAEQSAAAKRDFTLFDLDKNDQLTLDELRNIPYLAALNERGTLADPVLAKVNHEFATIQQKFSSWDGDKNDRLNDKEFTEGGLNGMIPELSKTTLEDWDADGDGTISLEDCQHALQSFHGTHYQDGVPLRLPSGLIVNRSLFSNYDRDEDGTISKQEFIQFRTNNRPEALQAADFSKLDADQSETLSLTEWANMDQSDVIRDRFVDPIARFLRLDTDGNGRIDRDELAGGSEKWLQDVTAYVFPGFDRDGDGVLSLDEYRDCMLVNRIVSWYRARQDANGDHRLNQDEFRWTTGSFALATTADYFQRLDTNHDDQLDPNEFFFKTKGYVPQLEFRRRDLNADDRLSQTEFEAKAKEAEKPAMPRNFMMLDLDHNNALTFEEFLNTPSIVPNNLRGSLPDPFVELVDGHMATLTKKWTDWDSDKSGELNESEFQTAHLAQTVPGLEATAFKQWDEDGSKTLSSEECRRVLEIAFGLRRLDGELLHGPSGLVYKLGPFNDWDTDDDNRLSWDEANARQSYKGANGRKKFDKADSDQDQFLSFAEFKPFQTMDTLNRFWNIDTTLDGKIDEQEWMAAARPYEKPIAKPLFAAFDDDHDGVLSYREFRLTPLANPVTIWHDLRDDADGDGVLAQSEFRFSDSLALSALAANLFNRLDGDSNGRLTLSEFPFNTRNVEVEFATRDTNGDKKLTETEFVGSAGNAKRMKRDFAVFDMNHDGVMSFEEFQTIPGILPLDDRHPIPDPLVHLVDQHVESIQVDWKAWDKDADGSLSQSEFEAAPLRQSLVGLETTSFTDWDQDANGVIGIDDARRTIEIAFGVRRPQGDLLRTANGRTVNWATFKVRDADHDGRLTLDECTKGGWEKLNGETRFRETDADHDGFVTFAEWKVRRYRLVDAVAVFLNADKDLDGQLNPDEVVAAAQNHQKKLAHYLIPAFDSDKNGTLSLSEFQLTPLVNLQQPWFSQRGDTDNDGRLSLAEFQRDDGLDAATLVAEYFARFDLNDDHRLDQDEFFFQTKKRNIDRDFKKLDADGDGTLTIAEYSADGDDKALRAAKRDFQLFDIDQDKALTLAEFKTIPDRVPSNVRAPFPDPFETLVDSRMADIEKGWSDWDTDANGQLSDREFFNSGFSRNIPGLELTMFHDWDRNQDDVVTKEDCRAVLEVAFGITTLSGHRLRLQDGRVVNWMLFSQIDENKDDRLSWDEFRLRTNRKDRAEQQFTAADTDQNREITYEEWVAAPSWLRDPVRDFLKADTDFDAKLSQEELIKGTSVWQQSVAVHIFPGFDTDADGMLSLTEYRMTPLANPLAAWQRGGRDVDNDGRLGLTEFRWGEGPELASLCVDYFNCFDANHDGRIDLSEFDYRINPARAPRSIVFQVRDADKDGRLSLDEVLGDTKPPADRQNDKAYEKKLARSEEGFHLADADGDGFLSLAEFRSDGALQAIAPNAKKPTHTRTVTTAEPAEEAADTDWRMWIVVGLNIVLVVGVVGFVIRKTWSSS